MISIHLSNERFQPGETIRGTLQWSQFDTAPETIEVRLIWFTKGKGNQDVEVRAAKSIDSPAESGEDSFEFVAPAHPYSFSGKLISLIWAVEVIAFPNHEAQQAEVTIGPGGKEILLESHA